MNCLLGILEWSNVIIIITYCVLVSAQKQVVQSHQTDKRHWRPPMPAESKFMAYFQIRKKSLMTITISMTIFKTEVELADQTHHYWSNITPRNNFNGDDDSVNPSCVWYVSWPSLNIWEWMTMSMTVMIDWCSTCLKHSRLPLGLVLL